MSSLELVRYPKDRLWCQRRNVQSLNGHSAPRRPPNSRAIRTHLGCRYEWIEPNPIIEIALPPLVDISERHYSLATMTSFGPPYIGMVNNTPLLLHLKLLVLLFEVVLDIQGQAGAKQASPAHDTSTGVVPGFLAVGEHVRCVKVRDSRTHEVDDGQGCGSL